MTKISLSLLDRVTRPPAHGLSRLTLLAKLAPATLTALSASLARLRRHQRLVIGLVTTSGLMIVCTAGASLASMMSLPCKQAPQGRLASLVTSLLHRPTGWASKTSQADNKDGVTVLLMHFVWLASPSTPSSFRM